MKQHTISLVTVCMNRLHHLQQTLPRNLKDNAGYERLEFVLLDYNSTDGLAGWVREEMYEYIDNGQLRYYQTLEPACYHPAHSRNMAFLLSGGDLICNVDADNFTGEHFAGYLNERFCDNEQSLLVTFGGSKKIAPQDTYGRICVTRSDFMAVKGYDEAIDQYCGEDIDLAKRVAELGRQTVVMEDERFLQRIPHDNTDRIGQMALLRSIDACYLTTDPAGFSSVLFLFRNDRFALVSLAGHKQRIAEEWQDACDEGTYSWTNDHLQLSFEHGYVWRLVRQPGINTLTLPIMHGMKPFYQVTEQHNIQFWTIQYMLRHIKTRRHNKQPVNRLAMGQGTVYQNFNYHQPLRVGALYPQTLNA